MMRASSVAVAIVLAMSTVPAVAGDVIEDASRFTVKTMTAIEYAFGSESKGAFRGSGFLVDRERGWILTNAHVVGRSPSTIRINFKDQPRVTAKKVYIDSHLDLAVVAVPTASIPAESTAAQLECDSSPQAGREVIAFGHPWGLDFTATRGIISGTKLIGGVEAVQTDAALNPGNSGGPLIDAATGKIVGINRATYSKSKAEGLSFAVPMKLVCTVLDLLRAGRDPAPPVMPVTFASSFNEGELIVAKAGAMWSNDLRPGDRIVAVDGQKQTGYASRVIDRLRGNEKTTFTISREGIVRDVLLDVPEKRDHVTRYGILTSGMIIGPSTLRTEDQTEMYVQMVDDASLAEQAQIHSGDIVSSIDGVLVRSTADVENALKGKAGKEVEVIVKRERERNASRVDFLVRRVEVEEIRIVTEQGMHVPRQ